MIFYGQCGEDKHVYEKYFKNKRNGVFLELGALDGQTYSNTKFSEETLGWTGVLIEPIPDYCNKIASHRSNSKVYNNIVSSNPEPMDIYINGAVSSVKEKMRYYLEHEDEREAIAKRLYDYVWTHHTWEARCNRILDVLKNSPSISI